MQPEYFRRVVKRQRVDVIFKALQVALPGWHEVVLEGGHEPILVVQDLLAIEGLQQNFNQPPVFVLGDSPSIIGFGHHVINSFERDLLIVVQEYL